MFKYSLPNLIKAYNENRDLIVAYHKGQSVEGFDVNVTTGDEKVLGMTIALFISVLVISFSTLDLGFSWLWLYTGKFWLTGQRL